MVNFVEEIELVEELRTNLLVVGNVVKPLVPTVVVVQMDLVVVGMDLLLALVLHIVEQVPLS